MTLTGKSGVASDKLSYVNQDTDTTLVSRLLRKLSVTPTGCWVWTGSCRQDGYGVILIKGKQVRVHRAAWIVRHGPIPKGMDVLHRCDVRNCLNDDHLFLGTDADNHQDKAAKGRHWQQKKTHCPAGHPYSPENTYLTPDGARKCIACRKGNRRSA